MPDQLRRTDDPRPAPTGLESQRLRQVLGHYPTGVCVVTAMGEDDAPVGMAVGSFTSVSLDPPLVGFLPAKSSTTFPQVEKAGRFCVNVLGADQEAICRALATKDADRFKGLDWRRSDLGSPILDGAVAWIDCELENTIDAGDHVFVLGRVHGLDLQEDTSPLLFFQGGYGRFSQESRAAAPESDLVAQLRLVDLARRDMQRLAHDLSVECLAVSLVGDEMVITGSAGAPRRRRTPTRLGQRVPHVPPMGAAFVAWADPASVDAWLARGAAFDHEAHLDRVRERGWSLAVDQPGLRDVEAAVFRMRPGGTDAEATSFADTLSGLADAYDPAEYGTEGASANNLMAPVRGPDGTVVLVLALYGLPPEMTGAQIRMCAGRLVEAAATVGAALAAEMVG